MSKITKFKSLNKNFKIFTYNTFENLSLFSRTQFLILELYLLKEIKKKSAVNKTTSFPMIPELQLHFHHTAKNEKPQHPRYFFHAETARISINRTTRTKKRIDSIAKTSYVPPQNLQRFSSQEDKQSERKHPSPKLAPHFKNRI